MRLAPVVMAYYPTGRTSGITPPRARAPRTAALECLDACRLLGDILYQALSGASKADTLLSTSPERLQSEKIQNIARGEYRDKPEAKIRGTGYVVQSLEAALWCFWTTDSFESAILKAANLGDDADTTAAICGQVAGAFYGESGIPQSWLEKLAMRDKIVSLANELEALDLS